MRLFTALLVMIGLASCGPIRNLEKMVGTTDDMKQETIKLNAGMTKTNNAIHLQVLTVALQQMTATENTEQLVPPARMMPPAFVFTEEATAHEILETFHTFWIDAVHGGTSTKDKPNAVEARLKSRQISRTAAAAIAAFTPQAKFNEIIKTQVAEKGRYEGTAYALAASRFEFIRDYMFEPTINRARSGELNLSLVSAAVDYYNLMKQIALYDFVDRMDFKIDNLTEVLDPDTNVTTLEAVQIKVTPDELRNSGRSMARYLVRNVPANLLNSAEMQKLIVQLQ